jgi:CRP-like cAMP-binding protein
MELILRKLKAFSDQLVPLDELEWDAFISGMRSRSLKKKEFFLTAGDVCNEIGFIGSGVLRAYYLKDGEEITSDICMDGMYCTNYVSFLTRSPSNMYMVALEPVEMVVFDREHLERLYASSRSAERMGRRIAESIFIHVASRNEQFLLESAEERYLSLLKDHAEVFQRIPQRHIASYLGVKPESLSRIRARTLRVSAS